MKGGKICDDEDGSDEDEAYFFAKRKAQLLKSSFRSNSSLDVDGGCGAGGPGFASTDSLPEDRSAYVKKFMKPPPLRDASVEKEKPKFVFPTLKETNILDLGDAEEAVGNEYPQRRRISWIWGTRRRR